MRILTIILLLFLGPTTLFLDDGEKDGRRGNRLYDEEAYEEAAEAFASGLAVLADDAPARLRYALHNNLGAALLRSGDAPNARQAFDQALAVATTDAEVTRTAYNAGNAAYAAQDLQAALENYRRSLLRDPDHADAKYNYEFVKRRLQEQEEQQQQQQEGDSDESDPRGEEDGDGENANQENRAGDNEAQPEQEQQNDDSREQDAANGEQQQRSPQQEGQADERLSEAQAERILQALQNEEEQLLREVQRLSGQPRTVEKDW
ncbi:MAG: tetratricopeptide repeat protein [Rhodothermales bacterium]